MGIDTTKKDIIELEWRDDMNENAKFIRDRRARNLRKAGYKVKVETIGFVDLGRFTLYRLTAYKEPKQKTCNGCRALNKFVINHYGMYYCWEKRGKKIFEGKDNLPIPTPGWCPKC